MSTAASRLAFVAMLLVTLLSFGLRVHRLAGVPPGWSDDELSNTLVIAQKPLRGDFALYYTDATGKESLYLTVTAGFLSLFGYNALGIRLLSALLGTLSVPLTYRVARRLFRSELLAVTAAAALAVSFWSLVYSRIALRHVSLLVFLLPAVYFFWGSWSRPANSLQRGALSGLFLGLGFYTYFAARGLPLILLAFCLYLALFRPVRFRQGLRGFLLMFALAVVLALPLVITLAGQTGADARVAEVAVPLVRAREGDWSVLQEHVTRTLNMFHADGDDEFLYNIPGRPIFGPLLALLFWGGVLLALWYALVRPLAGRFRSRAAPHPYTVPATFLLLWFAAGLVPAFLSVPPASLGHTLVAQPAVYILLALPLLPLQNAARSPGRHPWLLASLLAIALVAGVALRDLPDYFREWPGRGNTRFLYHADTRDVARYLERRPELADFAITGLLAGPWDRAALEIDLGGNPLDPQAAGRYQPRWYNPQRAILLRLEGAPAVAFTGYPVVQTIYEERYRPLPAETAGGYTLAEVDGRFPENEPVCFTNGLCWVGYAYEEAGGQLDLVWQVARPLTLPEIPLVSKPPPPGVYDGPRLLVFAQLVGEAGAFLAGDDGLWVDPLTLRPGDLFMQRHLLPAPAGTTPQALRIGLYDPLTGERAPTADGRDYIEIGD